MSKYKYIVWEKISGVLQPVEKVGDTDWCDACNAPKDKKHNERFMLSDKPEKEIDCTYTPNVVCPHCGHENEDSWEFASSPYWENLECPECGKLFDVEVIYDYSFVSKKGK